MYTSVINILTKVRIFINYFLFIKQNVQEISQRIQLFINNTATKFENIRSFNSCKTEWLEVGRCK